MLISLNVMIAFASYNKLSIDQSKTEKSMILSDIVTNYLIKYFDNEKTFVSIIYPASHKIEQKYFWHDFFHYLFDDPTFTRFDHNALHKLDDSIFNKRESFNIILIDENVYLE